MAKKKIRLGLIGCGGNMRRAHLPRFQADGAIEVIAATEPSDNAFEGLQADWPEPIERYTDHRKMLREHELDAVVISSPHSMHYDQARDSLKQGRHVLIEKPLVVETRHATSLVKLAEKQGVMLEVSYQRHAMPTWVYAREIVQKGGIGEVRGLVGYITQGWGGFGGWRQDPALSGGGMFMDTGSHLVASAMWVSGLQPTEVLAYVDHAGRPVDINAAVSLKFRGGAVGTLTTIGNARLHDERLAIHGSEGCLVIHGHQWRPRSLLVNNEQASIPKRIEDTTPDQIFFNHIRSGGRGYEPPHFAVEVARLSQAVYRSAEQGKPVRVGR